MKKIIRLLIVISFAITVEHVAQTYDNGMPKVIKIIPRGIDLEFFNVASIDQQIKNVRGRRQYNDCFLMV